MKIITLFFLLVITGLFANCQSLPNKQETGLWAPDYIKNENKITDGGNQFQAYNKTTEFFYTIANDDKNLYVCIKATKPSIIEKMMEGGIGFTINTTNKRDEDKSIVILFPLMNMQRCQAILFSAGKHPNQKNYRIHVIAEDTMYVSKADSSISKANSQLSENLKYIKVLGIKSIVDTVPGINDKTPYYSTLPLRDHHYKIISIANDDGIMANTLFDHTGNYNYRLVIPLSYLQLPSAIIQKLNYNIMIHGRGEDRRIGDAIQFGPPVNGVKEILYLDLETPTDFWGEYTLAKKP